MKEVGGGEFEGGEFGVRNYSGLSDQLLIVLYFPMECLINGRENAEHRRTFHRRSVMRLAAKVIRKQNVHSPHRRLLETWTL